MLVSDGRGAPLPPAGKQLSQCSSVTIALEVNGHWAKLSRNLAGVSCPLPPPDGAPAHLETLSGPYSWQCTSNPEEGAIIAMQAEIERDGVRLFFGDTGLHSRGGLQLL